MEYNKDLLYQELEAFMNSLEKYKPDARVVAYTGYEGAIMCVDSAYKELGQTLTRIQLESIVDSIPSNGSYNTDEVFKYVFGF